MIIKLKKLAVLMFFVGSIILPGFSQDKPDTQGKSAKVTVLCYHTFLGSGKYPTDFSMAEFREQIETLKNNGFNFISISDFLGGSISGDKNILLTIDDGSESVYRVYNDILKPLDIKPLLAIYPAIIGVKKYALTWEQLKELSDAGCSVASHGFFHEKIDKKLFDLSEQRFMYEIINSKKMLEEKTGRKIEVFSYPFGLKSGETVEALKKNGYKAAFTIDGGICRFPLKNDNTIFDLPRYMITRTTWKSTFDKVFKKTSK
ncbi:MAG: hypothetical protein A2297_06070 [Elusimicrobia bacterium RIFOXYB2_FULL_48_7]|nr:MAG: hypothetical protein A2297_06070 [Elusimicrobia bacterium RIFOXYB2_FULL_48_7]